MGLGNVEKGEEVVIEVGELKLYKINKLNQKMHLNGLLLLYEGLHINRDTYVPLPTLELGSETTKNIADEHLLRLGYHESQFKNT